ncbi:MAG TPA: hypothetical protein VMF33_06690, partial [Acidimicrobiales bacterium]|nr:hypothetical protein [Acidimicrobiales bacterium]
RIDCEELRDPDILAKRRAAWSERVAANGGVHPDAQPLSQRVLKRMRATALPALQGGGMSQP